MAYAGPKQETFFASVARIATPTAVERTAPKGCRGARITIDATAVTATPSIVFTDAAKDKLNGKLKTVIVTTAIATGVTTVLLVDPGATAAANLVVNLPIGEVISIAPVHGDADSITYSVAVEWLM